MQYLKLFPSTVRHTHALALVTQWGDGEGWDATVFAPADQLGMFVREQNKRGAWEGLSVHKYDLTGPNNVDLWSHSPLAETTFACG